MINEFEELDFEDPTNEFDDGINWSDNETHFDDLDSLEDSDLMNEW